MLNGPDILPTVAIARRNVRGNVDNVHLNRNLRYAQACNRARCALRCGAASCMRCAPEWAIFPPLRSMRPHTRLSGRRSRGYPLP